VELRNADFMQEARKLAELARLYGTDEADLVD
jgi:hypothetical protein